MADLKPCPFCGGEASARITYKGTYAVSCNRLCVGQYGYDTEKEAIEAWNTRKPMEAVVAKLEDKALESSSAQTEAIIGMCGASANYYSGEKDAYANAIEIVRGKE